MPMYRVKVKEVWEQVYELSADNKAQALDWAQQSGGEAVEGLFQFSHYLLTDDISVVEEIG